MASRASFDTPEAIYGHVSRGGMLLETVDRCGLLW
jgi:hypothetical protein